MLDTSKNVVFPGHNHQLTTGTDDPDALIIIRVPVLGHQYRWLAGGYDLEIYRSGWYGGNLVDSGFFAKCYQLTHLLQ